MKENYDEIFIEIFAPYCKGIDCKTKNETETWKKLRKNFNIITNKQKYEPNLYGDQMVSSQI